MKIKRITDDKLIEHLVSIPNCPDWLCFFLMFSRFEYALKCSRFVTTFGEVKASWGKFGEDKEVESKFAAQKSIELREAIKYLQDNPPKKKFGERAN